MLGRAACLAMLYSLLSAPDAGAQAPRSAPAEATLAASARAFFQQGLQFADEEKWGLAVDRFGRAMAIRRSPVIAYNLAASLGQLGSVIEAAELLREVEETAGEGTELYDKARRLRP